MGEGAILEVEGLDAAYGLAQILFDVSLRVARGEIVALMGRNGAGKSTTLKAIMGLVPANARSLRFAGRDIRGQPSYRIARLGLGYVPEERRIFTDLTVAENLAVGTKPTASGEPRAPWMPERAEELDRAALERRAGRRLSREDVDLLVSLGVVERSGDDTFRTTPSVLGMGLELIDLPVPAAVLREAAEVIHEHAAAVADGLTDVFRRGIWEPFRRGEAADRDQLAVVVSRLRPLVVRGLVNAFGHAADRAIRRTVAE